MAALRRAEAEKGSPPYVVEIARAWNSLIPMVAPLLMLVGLMDLYRNDELLADLPFHRFTLNPAQQSTE